MLISKRKLTIDLSENKKSEENNHSLKIDRCYITNSNEFIRISLGLKINHFAIRVRRKHSIIEMVNSLQCLNNVLIGIETTFWRTTTNQIDNEFNIYL